MEERIRVVLSSKHRVSKFRCKKREREKAEGETSNLSEKG